MLEIDQGWGRKEKMEKIYEYTADSKTGDPEAAGKKKVLNKRHNHDVAELEMD